MVNEFGITGSLYTGKKSAKVNADAKALIVKEAMAMLMRPVLEPYLPPHSWFLESTDVEKGVLGDAWKHIPGTERVEALARNVEYDSDGHSFLLWDMGATGLFIGNLQLKSILNHTRPYVSNWWSDQMARFMNTHGQGIKRLRKWTLTEDKYSSLPSLLIEIEFMRLDYSDTLKKNPLYRQIDEARKNDRKKVKVGVVNVRNVPKTLEKSEAHADYHRRGPTICFAYQGPQKLKEKLARAVALELKSSMQFDRKLVDTIGFSEKKPKARMTAAEKKRQKEVDAKYAEQELRVNIALAGSKGTKNRKRTALQEEGRRLQEEGRLHLDKTGNARMPRQNAE